MGFILSSCYIHFFLTVTIIELENCCSLQICRKLSTSWRWCDSWCWKW